MNYSKWRLIITSLTLHFYISTYFSCHCSDNSANWIGAIQIGKHTPLLSFRTVDSSPGQAEVMPDQSVEPSLQKACVWEQSCWTLLSASHSSPLAMSQGAPVWCRCLWSHAASHWWCTHLLWWGLQVFCHDMVSSRPYDVARPGRGSSSACCLPLHYDKDTTVILVLYFYLYFVVEKCSVLTTKVL